MKLYAVTVKGPFDAGDGEDPSECEDTYLVLASAAHTATAIASREWAEMGGTVESVSCRELIGADKRCCNVDDVQPPQ